MRQVLYSHLHFYQIIKGALASAAFYMNAEICPPPDRLIIYRLSVTPCGMRTKRCIRFTPSSKEMMPLSMSESTFFLI